MWNRALRIVAAVIIAPWMTLLVVGIHGVVAGIAFGHESWEMSLNFAPFALYGMLIAYLATIVIGLPMHLLLSYFKVGYVWVHAVIGGSIALLIGGFVFDLFKVGDWQVFVTYLTLFVLPGAAVAGAFGAIAGKPTPTKVVEIQT